MFVLYCFLLDIQISWCLKLNVCVDREKHAYNTSYYCLKKKKKSNHTIISGLSSNPPNTAALFPPNRICCFRRIMRHFKWARPLCANIIESAPLFFQSYPVDCNFTAVKYLGSSLLIQSTVGWEACTIGLQFTKADRLSVSVIPDATPPHLMGRFRLLNDSLLSVIQGAGIACLHVWIQNDVLRWASASEWL